MAEKRLKRPRDPISLAKLIGDIATGQVEGKTDDGKVAIAVERGRLGGEKGGLSRAAALSKDQRQKIARKAAKARWSKIREPAD